MTRERKGYRVLAGERALYVSQRWTPSTGSMRRLRIYIASVLLRCLGRAHTHTHTHTHTHAHTLARAHALRPLPEESWQRRALLWGLWVDSDARVGILGVCCCSGPANVGQERLQAKVSPGESFVWPYLQYSLLGWER